jgi:putative mRNA 3-end processing factor
MLHSEFSSMLIEPTDRGLYCAAGGFHIDPWQPVERAVITHAHADHLRPGCQAYLCAQPSRALVDHRLGEGAAVQSLEYGDSVDTDGVRVSFHPAGHILGSAQVRVEHRGEVWVASGDYKRAADPTCAPFEPQPCHTFITEATFGLPVFRWDEPDASVREILEWWDEMRAADRPAVLFAYALGKAQRVLASLAKVADRPVYVHGALHQLLELYRANGVRLPETRRASDVERGVSFAGELIVAPVSARGTVWMRRFRNHSSAFASGWMRIRGARRRRAYDRGFALSDHADWDALHRTIAETGASRVFVTHGYTQPLARALGERGIEAVAWQTQYEGEADSESPSENGEGAERPADR